MSKWLGVAVVAALASGCGSNNGAFSCATDQQCGAGGVCELGHGSLCSFPDSMCASGRRFGDLAGASSNKCVGEEQQQIDAGIDSVVDAPQDAQACFGTGLLRICLASAPTEPLMIPNPTTIITTNSPMCAAVISGGDYCVLAGTTITIDGKLRATGTRPLVLIATDSITTGTQIDVGSHRAANPETGAGADPSTCALGTDPTNGGGGAGGSFTGLGGTGGNGNSAASGGGVPGAIAAPITVLRGGCPGQDGQAGNANDKGARGHGGGAVFLIAGNMISVGGGINAAGEGGTGGAKNTSGGGGGGAGGMIGFDAPTITITSLILANGGGGAEGSGTGNNNGNSGADPTAIGPAAAGGGNSSTGGDGGDGSAGAAAGVGADGKPGTGGGGGGGGGAGLVKAPATASLGTQVSPLAIP